MAVVKKTKKAPAKKGVKSGAKKAAAKTKKAPKKTKKISFKAEMTRTLLDAKQKILQEVSQKVRSESDLLRHEIGDIYDIASKDRERELALMLGDRERRKLAEIDHALERMRESSYGACEECGEAIAENRLRALPFTRVCVDCQSRHERELKIRGRVEEEPGIRIIEKPDTEEEDFN